MDLSYYAILSYINKKEIRMNILIMLAIGAVAGWLAGILMKGGGFGLIGNIIIGVFGAVVGGFIFSFLGISAGGLIGSIVMATVGAAILLAIVGVIKRA